MNDSLKESSENYDKFTILDLHFVKDNKEILENKENQWHLYYNSKNGLHCIINLNLKNRKLVDHNFYLNCEPNNYRGTLFGIEKNTQNIDEFSTLEKVNSIGIFDRNK